MMIYFEDIEYTLFKCKVLKVDKGERFNDIMYNKYV